MVKHAEVVAWWKKDFKIGHGNENAIVLRVKYPALAKEKIQTGEWRE